MNKTGVITCATGDRSNAMSTGPRATSSVDPESRDKAIDNLLKSASNFGSQALDILLSQGGDDAGPARGLAVDYVNLVYQLEVHFLFPNLQEPDRHLLVGLGTARTTILASIGNGRQNGILLDRPSDDANLLEIKHRFVSLRAEVMNRGLVSRMTPLQEALLEREFLTLPKPQPAA
jgi:hypothetical protein